MVSFFYIRFHFFDDVVYFSEQVFSQLFDSSYQFLVFLFKSSFWTEKMINFLTFRKKKCPGSSELDCYALFFFSIKFNLSTASWAALFLEVILALASYRLKLNFFFSYFLFLEILDKFWHNLNCDLLNKLSLRLYHYL